MANQTKANRDEVRWQVRVVLERWQGESETTVREQVAFEHPTNEQAARGAFALMTAALR